MAESWQHHQEILIQVRGMFLLDLQHHLCLWVIEINKHRETHWRQNGQIFSTHIDRSTRIR